MKLHIDIQLKNITNDQNNRFFNNLFIIEWPFNHIPRVGEIVDTGLFIEQIPSELTEGILKEDLLDFITVKEVAFINLWDYKTNTYSPIIELKLSDSNE